MWWKKLKLLIWKNFLLQRRHQWQTVFEIASPVIFAMFLILLRCLVDPKIKPEMKYQAFNPNYLNMSGKDLGNMSETRSGGSVAFSPESNLTRGATMDAMYSVLHDNLSGLLALLFDINLLPAPVGYKDAQALENALVQPNIMDRILVGVEFDDKMAYATEWPEDIVVKVRFPAVMRIPMLEHPLRASWRTNLLLPLFPRPGPREPDDMFGGKMPGYSGETFLAVQHAISQAIIKQKTGKPVPTKVLLQRYPQPAYREDMLLVALERFISMILMLCFAYTFVNTVRTVTAEKELQLKETMTIMGLPSWLHWLAWFIKQFSFLLISVCLMMILLKMPLKVTATGYRYSVLTHTPWTILFFFLTLFIISSLCFCFMVSVFFSKANTAASFMGLAWFATYSVFMLTQVLYEDITLTTKFGLSLISNTAFGYACQMLIICEGNSVGLRWANMFKPVSYHDNFTPGDVAMMMVIDSILYMLIALYVEKIKPGLYGVPLPWYFPFTLSFWFPKELAVDDIPTQASNAEYNAALLNVVHDEEPTGVPLGVHIQNLTKIYKGTKKAVDNLNLRVYENEITVLLGHNGAGKTTTISMLTGTVPPTSGFATINGYNVVTETEQARASLGICPQHNVLFPDLTVAEHIQFYAQLKGVSKANVDAEVDHFVALLDLEDKREVNSRYLSGGQKRRLSVGAAMCGDSKVVLLDEPTSGLDPAARRALWDLLQREKKGRTMILTTHFMDEADILGDRIAIMSGGRLQCLGTSYFLKKHYGLGYKLTIVKQENCEVYKVTEFLHTHVPHVNENTNIGSELTYILANDDASKFPNMLKQLEEKKDTLLISSYGLSITNLEEVFMKVGAEEYEQVRESAKSARYRGMAYSKSNVNGVVHPLEAGSSQMDHLEKVKGLRLLRNHIKAMFLKLFYHSSRNKLMNFIQFLSPVINIILSVIISRSWKFISQLPPLVLSLESGFKNTETLVSQVKGLASGSVEEKAYIAFKDKFKSSSYPGMYLNDIGTSDMGEYYLKLMQSDVARVRMETLIGATFAPGTITGWFSNYGYHDSAIALAAVDGAIMSALSPGTKLTIINHPLPYSINNLVRVMASGSSMGFQFAFNIGFCMAFVTSFLVLFVIKERLTGAKLLQRISGVRPAVMWGCAFVWDWFWMFLIYLCIIITLACFQESTLSTPEELGRILLVLMAFSVATIPFHYLMAFYFNAAATGFAKMCFINIFAARDLGLSKEESLKILWVTMDSKYFVSLAETMPKRLQMVMKCKGCMPFLITEVLRLPEVGSTFYAHFFDYLFSPLPIYCLSRSFRDMSVSAFTVLACDGLCAQFPNIVNCTRDTICHALQVSACCIQDESFLKWEEPGVGRYLFMMTLVGSILFTVLLVKEYQLMNKVFYQTTSNEPVPLDPQEDSDVAAERDLIENMTASDREDYSLITRDLTKYYDDLLAVNRLTFAVRKGECFGLLGINGAGKTTTFRMLTGDSHISSVRKGECFGLLGINGAGKTTTFRMLTGDSHISSGDALVHGYSIKTQIQKVHRLIGYCPQFDALLDNLTARETLQIFCLLRGIPQRWGAARAQELARALGFTRHFDKKVYACSGGTKRKISTAVALLGDAPLIYLDEPTTGMDPASKRLVWTCINDAVKSGRSVVLTSHSMEECEALCSRLTICVNGRLYCLGPLQHLKSKFSQGYTVIVKHKADANNLVDSSDVKQFILEKFADAKLIEQYMAISTFYVNDEGLPWWQVFQTMEEAVKLFPIEDYSVSQTTLEQVFLRFTRLYAHTD